MARKFKFWNNRKHTARSGIRRSTPSRRRRSALRTTMLSIETLEDRRLLAGGNLDTTFNPAGAVPGTLIADLGFIEDGQSVAVQADGKILIAGTVENSALGANSRNYGVARFLS